ncbi:VOC family protein [Pseudonocardia charpentierae]|uniref:VOC family protein n=1 Tax=Pseudonocardia charpentierae TaxID=3075545 RepID=A0ABU2NEC9_9PSEU|nr:VOC family protein [Pseudonocardia sp. DSM 45834]MDT0352096.1 VOC family protein [Pseudonocardia sp. DSM 45834]
MEVLAGRVLIHPTDLARSTVFYRDVLGLAVFREFPGGTVFFLGGGYLEVSGRAAGSTAGGVQLWMQVRDLVAVHGELAAAGVTVLREPRREPWGLDEMWIADPDGLRIVVVEVPPEHPMRRDPRS